jgi:ABC-type antimicrobial peptide transport system permease subunit
MQQQNKLPMIRNYFKVAWRNLAKNKAYSSINIAGLAIGMAVALLIGLWIRDEVSYNQNFANYSRIVRIKQFSTHGDKIFTWDQMPIPLAGELRTKYADDFRQVALASWNYQHVITVGDKIIEQDGIYAQPELPDMLSLRMKEGSYSSLKDPSHIIIDQSLANALFGKGNAMNATLKIDNRTSYRVVGVFADLPVNCDFYGAHMFMPWNNFVAENEVVKADQAIWNSNSYQIFARLRDGIDAERTGSRIKDALKGHGRKDKPVVFVQSMSQWHLYGEFRNGKNAGGEIEFVWMFAVIGIFVLILACINFMNLSTARSEKRSREVGIRKAMGSLRGQLIGQFLGESLLITCISFGLAILAVQGCLHWFNQLAAKQIAIPWTLPLFWLSAFVFVVCTGLVAGSYPAFYLSSFSATHVLKGSFKAGSLAALPRKILVVLQFTVSVSLIIGTLIVFRQIQYARNRPIGYNREGLMTIFYRPDLWGHYDALSNDLYHSGAISSMAQSGSPTTDAYAIQSGFDWPGKDPNLSPGFNVIPVSVDFGRTVGWQFVGGRDFSRDYATDSSGLILNETAVKYMGLKKPVGETVKYLYTKHPDKNFRVVGVIRDMVMQSPFEPVKPTIFMLDTSAASFNVMTLKVNSASGMAAAIGKISAIYKKYSPFSPFDFSFNDDDYANKFVNEQRIGNLAGFFAAFAIFISCLGLFGLASYMAEQRNKEIGIRKVLGASVLNLCNLLSRDFLILVLLSFLIAFPLSWYGMHRWLQRYDYRTDISIWVFLIAGLLALGITLLTVSFQSVRAALSNPIKSLRTE